MPRYFLFEVRDSDGNDCTVFDAIVSAASREEASEKLWAHLEATYPDDETDGSYGTFHACDCECEHGMAAAECETCGDGWECSHGGLLTNEDVSGPHGPQEFDTASEAFAARVRHYHSLIDLTEE